MPASQDFALDHELIYLNHAAIGVWPKQTAEAVQAFAENCALQGAANYPEWLEIETQTRQLAANLLHLDSVDELAFVKNTSEGLSLIAEGLDWQTGDEIIVAQQEFPSNRMPWEAQQRHGVILRQVDLRCADPEAAYIEAMNEHTRLLSVSSVQYANGLRMDLPRLSAACHERDIIFVVDAIQSLGALDFDQTRIQADAIVADAHKWLLSPEGIALFYCAPDLREQLQLRQWGWHMVEQAGNYTQADWQVAANAIRFECGSPNSLGIHALHESLSVLLQTGLENIERNVLNNTRYLIDILKNIPGLNIRSSSRPERLSGALAFDIEGINSHDLYQCLMRRKVICAERDHAIRWSPHYYTGEKRLLEAVKRLQQCLDSLRLS